MNTLVPKNQKLSYELYSNYSDSIDVPLDSQMPLETKYEIYISKLVYLENLMTQCLRGLNKDGSTAARSFSTDDFVKIQNSYFVTKDLLRECVFTKFRASLEAASKLANGLSWHQQERDPQ